MTGFNETVGHPLAFYSGTAPRKPSGIHLHPQCIRCRLPVEIQGRTLVLNSSVGLSILLVTVSWTSFRSGSLRSYRRRIWSEEGVVGLYLPQQGNRLLSSLCSSPSWHSPGGYDEYLSRWLRTGACLELPSQLCYEPRFCLPWAIRLEKPPQDNSADSASSFF